ncbi:MAG: hypothetical protein HOH66_10550 [Rhodospirillaceae bacterium]|jgi:hypothetical protein|nr:hypothetical protein [Rhodospirillaceae bacterium]MBT6118294.1 hypothetical protein [Rhodospirillaceae bacterium]
MTKRSMEYGGRAALAAVLMVLALPATAETLIGQFGDWDAFEDGEGAAKVCYMASLPKSEKGDYTSRGQTYFTIVHRPGSQMTGVVRVTAGYEYKAGSETTVKIDDKTFQLYTHPDTPDSAWAPKDASVRKAMIAGRSMVVKGTSGRGTVTTDSYSLSGVTAAYKAIGKACGVK